MNKFLKTIELENLTEAEFPFKRNFSGRPGKFDRGSMGKRKFSVKITDSELVELMVENGWRVKTWTNSDGDTTDFIEVEVSYKYPEKAPKIYYVNSDNMITYELGEEDVADIDDDLIERCDMVISGSRYQGADGEWKTAAYLKEMYIELASTRIHNKFHRQSEMQVADLDPEDVFDESED